jgi:protein-L-isoaspartate(D-aspartate) O-methyltransferase
LAPFPAVLEALVDLERARAQMIGQQLRAWDVLDERVLDALATVPREGFVPEAYRSLAFADTAIPLPHGQEMMAPKIEGRLLQSLDLEPHWEVLEIGTGTGFLAACLSRLARRVHTVDIFADFVDAARLRLEAQGIGNVTCEAVDALSGQLGGSYDAVAVTGSLPVMDERLIRLVKPGGRLFAILGEAPVMEAVLITRHSSVEWRRQGLFETCVPPLINAAVPSRFEL